MNLERFKAIKKEHPGAMLLFRVGDFHELYGDDATTASKVLGLTLTTREKSGEEPFPMAGFPYHQLEGYLQKLIAAGYRVAVCDQVGFSKPYLRLTVEELMAMAPHKADWSTPDSAAITCWHAGLNRHDQPNPWRVGTMHYTAWAQGAAREPLNVRFDDDKGPAEPSPEPLKKPASRKFKPDTAAIIAYSEGSEDCIDIVLGQRVSDQDALVVTESIDEKNRFVLTHRKTGQSITRRTFTISEAVTRLETFWSALSSEARQLFEESTDVGAITAAVPPELITQLRRP